MLLTFLVLLLTNRTRKAFFNQAAIQVAWNNLITLVFVLESNGTIAEYFHLTLVTSNLQIRAEKAETGTPISQFHVDWPRCEGQTKSGQGINLFTKQLLNSLTYFAPCVIQLCLWCSKSAFAKSKSFKKNLVQFALEHNTLKMTPGNCIAYFWFFDINTYPPLRHTQPTVLFFDPPSHWSLHLNQR